MNLGVVGDEREILTLLRRERLRLVGYRVSRLIVLVRKRVFDVGKPVVHGIQHAAHTRFRAVVRLRSHVAGEIVDIIQSQVNDEI